jgi:tetratricopeptide (TPR) repeat protein
MRKILMFVLVVTSLVYFNAYAEVPDAVRANRSAVVTIYIYENNKQVASGSGFIMDASGKVVTNAHVISELNKGKERTLLVKMDNGSWLMPGDFLAYDADMDVAIFSVSARNLPFVRLARNYVPKEGEDIYVIGSPMGLETSFSSGIISGVRGSDSFLQITAPISPGSSGSPVFNAAGEVIGVATMIMKESQNLNFAVPIKYVYLLSERKKEERPSSIASATSAGQSAKVLDKEKEQATSVNSSIEITKLYQRLSELVHKGNYEEAADIATQALEKNQDRAIYSIRGAIYVDWITALKKVNSEDPMIINLRDKAVIDLNKAIELLPNNANDHYQLAQVMHENSGQELEYPWFEEDQGKLAEYYQKRRSYNVDILMHLTKAISLDPANAEYYRLRSVVYSTQNDNNMAIEDMSSAISLNPKSAQYYFRRGYLYCTTKQKVLARRDYIKAMDISGKNEFSNCFDAREKVDIYSELIMRHKDNSNFYFSRADALNDLNQNEKALTDINISIKIKKKSSNVRLRGIIYDDSGKYQNAINDYSAILSGNLEGSYNRYDLLRRRSISYYRMGNIGEAFTDMDSSCKVKSNSYAFGEDSCEMAEFLRKELLRGKKWVMLSGPSLYNRDVTKSFYYDRTSIQKKPNGNYLSWFRLEESKDSKIENLKKSGLESSTSKYDNYSHELVLWEFNCSNMSIGYVSYVDYDTEGNIIDSYSSDVVKLEPFVPESYGDIAYKTICKGDNAKDKSVKKKKKK